MFTINIYLKLALIAACIIGGVVMSATLGFGYSWIFLLTGILLLVSYLMLGTVQSTAKLVQIQDFEAAEKRLSLTLTPKLLYVTNRAFYYIMYGSLAMNKKENKEAEDYFNKALSIKLPSDNERAMVLMQLANINGSRNKWNAAKNYFREAKKLKVTEGALKEQMVMFEQAMGNQKAMRTSGAVGKRGKGMMMQPGGKRRRPRAR